MYSIDLAILYFFNCTLTSPALDVAMGAITNVHYWYPVYVFAGIYLIYRYKWSGVRMVVVAILLITLTDSLAHYVLKPLVDRVRPCSVVPWIRLPEGSRGDPSFPSNHALNNFAIATFFALIFRKRSVAIVLLALAALISIGRVYEGLHYPSDVLGGAAIGIIIGFLFVKVFANIERKITFSG